MRNLPLVAFRLTNAQRVPAEELAARRHTTVNNLARDALLAELARDAAHVNARKNGGPIGARAGHVEYDEG